MKQGCPICSKNDFSIIGDTKPNKIALKFINEDYKVVKCRNCSTYFVHPYIDFNDSQWAELYNSEYFAYQSEWLSKKRKKEISERLSKAESFLNVSDKINFLDIGAGEGKALIEGKKRKWNVTGIDIVDNRIEEAKDTSINFLVGKFLEIDLPENYYSIVYLDSVLEHVLQPLEYISKIKRILKPGGILYVGIPNEDCLFNTIRKIAFRLIGQGNISEKLKPFDSPYHVIGFNKSSFNFLIKKANLQIKYFRNFGRKFNFLSCKITSKAFWIALFFLLPIEYIGYLTQTDVYFEAYLSKEDPNHSNILQS